MKTETVLQHKPTGKFINPPLSPAYAYVGTLTDFPYSPVASVDEKYINALANVMRVCPADIAVVHIAYPFGFEREVHWQFTKGHGHFVVK